MKKYGLYIIVFILVGILIYILFIKKSVSQTVAQDSPQQPQALSSGSDSYGNGYAVVNLPQSPNNPGMVQTKTGALISAVAQQITDTQAQKINKLQPKQVSGYVILK